MIKNSDRYKYINSDNINRKKITPFVNVLTVFVLVAVLLMGLAASNWNVYGQSNETDTQSETLANVIPNTAEEQKNEGAHGQSSSENGSSANDSENTRASQIIAEESNSQLGAIKSQPDGDCLYDPSLPKCAPDENGKCPEGFGMNEDEQCFPYHDKCPEGYHSHEDDESGRCIPDSVPCDPGYIMSPDFPTCEYKDFVCQKHPNLNDCKEEGNGAPSKGSAYNSGYSHGCSDAKISDYSKRYVNQPGKGPNYHTQEFMNGYNDGFETCSTGNNQSNSKGTFKVIVQVTNQLRGDTYGGVTINVDNYPDNIFKAAYGLYFPAGQTVSKEFTFKSSDVPIGKEFDVNLDYGDDYNQYIFGMNTPAKKPEIVQFFIQ